MENKKETNEEYIARLVASGAKLVQKTGAFMMPVSAKMRQLMENDRWKKVYTNTTYRVFDPPLDIRIGGENVALGELLSHIGHTNWAFLTASNPYSRKMSLYENYKRNEVLHSDLNQYRVFKGEGKGDDGRWRPEQSFLVVGIHREVAVFLGRKYEQRAIVIGEGRKAELVMLA
jgi:hypothetical protein